MTRTATLALLAATAVAAAGLYAVSYEVSALEEELQAINAGIVSDREAIHVLHAEWSLLNQPARLRDLSGRHLQLGPLARGQVGIGPGPAPLPPAAPAPVAIAGSAGATAAAQQGPLATPAAARSLDEVLADLLGDIPAAPARPLPASAGGQR